MAEQVQAHVFISGRVQGVGFRASAQQRARQAGLGGWVRNLSDGRVEAVFEGDKPRVEELVNWCRRGPSYAQVDNIDVDYSDSDGEFSSFRVRY